MTLFSISWKQGFQTTVIIQNAEKAALQAITL